MANHVTSGFPTNIDPSHTFIKPPSTYFQDIPDVGQAGRRSNNPSISQVQIFIILPSGIFGFFPPFDV
jgi:hypothetical protein